MSDFNIGDMDKIFQKQGGIVGKRTKPSKKDEQPQTLKDWVKQMDDKNQWPDFEKQVKDFADKFEISFAKAMIYLMFDIF